MLGKFGQLHPSYSEKYGINNTIYLFELDLEPLLISCSRKGRMITKYKAFPTFPTMERDISFLVEKSVTCSEIISLILIE